MDYRAYQWLGNGIPMCNIGRADMYYRAWRCRASGVPAWTIGHADWGGIALSAKSGDYLPAIPGTPYLTIYVLCPPN